ncbi:MAG: hypothetical protein QXH03_00060 [Candidatus Bathyarchaeia archaeon]
MARKTALQILYEVIKKSPAPQDVHELRRELEELLPFLPPRGREVVHYLVKASLSTLGKEEKGWGSLKHVLWSIRDRAGEDYEKAMKEVIREVLEGNFPLQSCFHHLKSLPPEYSRMIEGGEGREELISLLEFREVGPFRVAINRTSRNLASIAFREGADYYIAVSSEGAVVMGKQRPVREVRKLSGEWVYPYPNMAKWVGEGLPDLGKILQEVEGWQ